MEYDSFNQMLVDEIKSIIKNAKRKVAININLNMLYAYWSIGKLIVEEEKKSKYQPGYGDYIVTKLSKELNAYYGKGFSRSNLFSMKKFYILFPKVQTLSGQLSWSHYLQIIQISDSDERNYYISECEQSNWSVRELARQIKALTYHRSLLLAKQMHPTRFIELLNKKNIKNK